jgi:metal-responsive CopG/Arc/MetJ family transcriptional regulator
MFDESQQLIHIRLPETVMGELDEARRLLAEPSVAQLIRRAVREFLENHDEEIRRRRKRETDKHGKDGAASSA